MRQVRDMTSYGDFRDRAGPLQPKQDQSQVCCSVQIATRHHTLAGAFGCLTVVALLAHGNVWSRGMVNESLDIVAV